MLKISEQALREGAERACDLFRLGRLRAPDGAEDAYQALWRAFGISAEQQQELAAYLADIVPVRGMPDIEVPMTWGLAAGVLVGLLMADSASPLDPLGDVPVLPS
jgi:hypothetical protein